MAAKFSVVIDCTEPGRLARFWVAALRYQIEAPPDGFPSWKAFWHARGVPDAELEDDEDSIVDPAAQGPRIWFQKVDETKSVKNRLHFDLHAGGGHDVPLPDRKARVDAEARRLTALGAVRIGTHEVPGVDHYAAAMTDPEGNEFDIN